MREVTAARSARRLATLDDVVRDYIRIWQRRQGGEQRWFTRQPSVEEAIKTAAMAVSPCGKRLNHQRRIPKLTLRAWTRALLRRKRGITAARNFDTLHGLLSAVADDLHGIGALTVYDTAVRIGAFLRLRPKFVYLHAGTRAGARALGLAKGERLRRTELPAPFRRLSPGDIEDCLCIYKSQIAAVMRRRTARVPGTSGCAPASLC